MTNHEADPQGSTVELPADPPATPAVSPPAPETRQPEPEASPPPAPVEIPLPPPPHVVAPAAPGEREVLYVPLAVNIGDGFKFGCGFFLAMVIALLVGFVVLAALFVITGLFGLNLPLTR